MRILIVHNQLWAHYKSRLFSEIHRSLKANAPESEMLVLQIALYESSRKTMQADETIAYDYPYQVLFEKSLDETGLKARTTALFRAFDAFKPTILNITGYADWAQVALMLYARYRGVKVVVSSESSEIDQHRSFLKERVKKSILSQAQGFFCFGKTSKDYLESLGVDKAKILVQHAAVIDEDVVRERFTQIKKRLPQSNTKRFVYVGRLAPEKNLPMLIRAFDNISSVRSGENDWELVFVGDGPERQVLQNQAKNMVSARQVHFVGGLPWYRVPEWLAKSDILVLPSTSEPWGLVVNEAMTCGMPVIVSDKCGCVADLVLNGKNGFTFDPLRQPDLEKAMLHFLRNPEEIGRMGQNSLPLIAPFNSRKVAGQMVAAYQNL